MKRAINDGKNLVSGIDVILLDQLRKSFLEHESLTPKPRQHVITDPTWLPAPTSHEVLQKMRSWSESQLDKSFTFTPIVSVLEFFSENTSLPLPEHPLEKSPCYPIIDFKAAGRYILYSCSLHPNMENVNLESIEHHCKYHNTVSHDTEILTKVDKR